MCLSNNELADQLEDLAAYREEYLKLEQCRALLEAAKRLRECNWAAISIKVPS